jgi:hypothetical protein
MRGNGYKNIAAENVMAMNAYSASNQAMANKKRMCWKCQKDKHTKGGHIKMFAGGPMKFICKECLDGK